MRTVRTENCGNGKRMAYEGARPRVAVRALDAHTVAGTAEDEGSIRTERGAISGASDIGIRA
jgi:hypothetical protein